MLLTRGADVNARLVDGRTPVYQASLLANGKAVLQLLLEKGANPNTPTMAGQTPLMGAAARGDADAMAMLIAKGAEVNARNGAGETALMFAATNGDPRTVQLLLSHGADAKVRSKRNETALGNASTAGVEETVRLLLDRGAEVNVQNFRGYSPLMLAASSEVMPAGIVKLLLDRGAKTDYTGDYDENARDLAAKRGDTEVTRLLGGVAKTSGNTANAANTKGQASVPKAIETALALLEKQSHAFIRIGGCNSCHSQDLPSVAAGFARDFGVAAPQISQLPPAMMPSADRIVDLDAVNVASLGWQLFDFGVNREAKSAYSDSIVRYIKAMQSPDGHWATSENRRPPMNAGDYQAAALAIYSLKNYGPAAEKTSTDTALAKAVQWLQRAKPSSTQDRAFHLLGLGWGSAPSTFIKDAAKSLAAMQRPDGGWSQLPGMESDAYATGQVMYALYAAAKMSVTDPVYQKGVQYLLRSQAPDGSWLVKTRAIWLQPYFESGFPYGRDQFISTAGTAWASMALTPLLERQTSSERKANRNR